MNTTNEQVQHQQYGFGTVVTQTTTMVEVQFKEEPGIKKFIYPSAFESFLELCDPASKKIMDDNLRQIHEQIEQENIRKQNEAEKSRIEERRYTLEHKRTAPKKSVGTKIAPKIAKRIEKTKREDI